MTLSSISRTVRARYSGDDCLYTDHNGLRVIADIEGDGRFQVTGDSAEILIDGSVQSGVTVFNEHLLVLAQPGADCEVLALLGPDPQDCQTELFIQQVEGCGWVVSSDKEIVIDDNHAPISPPAPGFPVPFFKSVTSKADMHICLEDSLRTETIDSFKTTDQDALKAREWKVQNGSDAFQLDSTFSDDTELAGSHMSHLNTASWNVSIPTKNEGLIIRKLYDRFHGRQRARVLIDGAHAGWWYEPGQDRSARWAWASFGVPSALTNGKQQIRVGIDPPAGVPLWDVSQLEILALLRE